MSVSEMNMSWSTASAQVSSKPSRSSTFLTETNKGGQEIRRKPVSTFAYTEDPCYNDTVCYQRFYCKIEFAVIKELDMYPSKA